MPVLVLLVLLAGAGLAAAASSKRFTATGKPMALSKAAAVYRLKLRPVDPMLDDAAPPAGAKLRPPAPQHGAPAYTGPKAERGKWAKAAAGVMVVVVDELGNEFQFYSDGATWWHITKGQACATSLEGRRSMRGTLVCAGTSSCGVFTGSVGKCTGDFQWVSVPSCKKQGAACAFALPAAKGKFCYMATGGRCD